MSDTPRTDATVMEQEGAPRYAQAEKYCALARDLERELNAANARIEQLEDIIDRLTD